MTFHLKIQIDGLTKPPVWRKLTVPANFTFAKFHRVIQAAFGWENAHLWGFRDLGRGLDNFRVGIPYDDPIFGDDLNDGLLDARETKLSDIFNDGFRKLLYTYDYGDNWEHLITLEAIGEESAKKAVCTKGKGACPPEDCGGVWGYTGMKEFLATNPDNEDAAELREWLGLEEGEALDTTAFDIDEVNIRLRTI